MDKRKKENVKKWIQYNIGVAFVLCIVFLRLLEKCLRWNITSLLQST